MRAVNAKLTLGVRLHAANYAGCARSPDAWVSTSVDW